jgi:drug/metabolite transporter (DMT)-like permease
VSWILLSVLSAILLGFYEAAKKDAVSKNAVPAVLQASVLCGAIIWILLMMFSRIVPQAAGWPIAVEPLSWSNHGLIAIKSVITASSWFLAYTAMQTLPLSVSSPLRSTGPIWTISCATLLFHERPSRLQWLGIAIILVSLYAFSSVGRREGIDFRRHRGVWLMLAGTLIGAISGLYDKYLLQSVHISAAAVQAWFSVYLVPVVFPLFLYWYYRERDKFPFNWRVSIPMIATLLLLADFAYFTALADPRALVSIVSPVRRLGIVVALVIGILHLKETQAARKSVCVGAMLMGVLLISLGN